MVRRGEGRAEPKSEPFDLAVDLVPALTYGHELWVVSKKEKTRSRKQAEMFLPRTAAGL